MEEDKKKQGQAQVQLKNSVRASKEWKQLRQYILENQAFDPITGAKLTKGFHLHHVDPAHYDDLNPEKFVGLNPKTHSTVEFLARINKPVKEKVAAIKNILYWMEIYEELAK